MALKRGPPRVKMGLTMTGEVKAMACPQLLFKIRVGNMHLGGGPEAPMWQQEMQFQADTVVEEGVLPGLRTDWQAAQGRKRGSQP